MTGATENIDINSALTVGTGGNLSLTSGGNAGSVNINSAVSGDGQLDITSDNVDVNAAVTTATTTVETLTADADIQVGGASAGDLYLDDAVF